MKLYYESVITSDPDVRAIGIYTEPECTTESFVDYHDVCLTSEVDEIIKKLNRE